jgi:hypothetical protein
VLLAFAAGLVGIDDNPPGIFLAFLASAAFILAFIHPWRAARQYRNLFLGSAFAFIVLVVLHNLLDVAAMAAVEAAPLHMLFAGLSVIAFLLAVLFAPTASIIGLVGWGVMTVREQRAER